MGAFEELLLGSGFTVRESPLLVSAVSPDGRRVSMFPVADPVRAGRSLVPRKYLVVLADGDAWRLPTVEWETFRPVAEQPDRPDEDVATEFRDVFLPALLLPAGDTSTALSDRGDRYELDCSLERTMTAAGLHWASASHPSDVPVFSPSGAQYRVTTSPGLLVVVAPRGRTELPLEGRTWQDVEDWLRAVAP